MDLFSIVNNIMELDICTTQLSVHCNNPKVFKYIRESCSSLILLLHSHCYVSLLSMLYHVTILNSKQDSR
jgi:hypothetical protein